MEWWVNIDGIGAIPFFCLQILFIVWWCVNFRDLWYIIISIYFNEGDKVDILELMHKRHSVRK